jgi:hypothetical protein
VALTDSDEFVLMKCESQEFSIRLTERNALKVHPVFLFHILQFTPQNLSQTTNKQLLLTRNHVTLIRVSGYSLNLKQLFLTS